MRRSFCVAVASLGVGLAAAPSLAERPDAGPPPEKYICPNTPGPTAVDCFLDAVEHLYTMCRHVKSIEIIEFGYEKSEEGVNSAKSEYCLDKQKLSMTRPYQAALREATGNRSLVDALRAEHELWLKALSGLKWQAPETDAEYKARVAKPYDAFREQAHAVRTAIASAPPKGGRHKAAARAAAKGGAN
jgi:hypothetical protein